MVKQRQPSYRSGGEKVESLYQRVQDHFDQSSLHSQGHLPWMNHRIVWLVQTGSYAQGTQTEQSDRDVKGVCVPPKEYLLGFQHFEEYNTTGSKRNKSTKEDLDITILSLYKFVKNAINGSPQNIEMIYARQEDQLILHPIIQPLLDHRYLFLSKKVYFSFGRYAKSQMETMLTKVAQRKGSTEWFYGYDTKLFMHVVRWYTSAIEILITGDYHTYRSNRQELLNCRNGNYSLEEAKKMVQLLETMAEEAYHKSTLPDQPDEERIQQLLITIYQQSLCEWK